MRKHLSLIAGLLLLSSPALADWTGKNAGGTTITFKNAGDCTSVVCVPIAQPVDSSGNAFAVIGNPMFQAITDGINKMAVKAASAAPVAADPAAVFAISPNTGEVGTPATGFAQPTGGVGLSGWLSGIYNKIVTVWSSSGAATGWFTVWVQNTNGNGSNTSNNSSPVVIASDQAAVAVKGNAANGSAVSGNPNLVGGSDGTNARTISTDTAGNVNTRNGASNTNTIAASQTAQIMSATSGGTTGTTGDYLGHCEIMPATTSPGAITISDNATTIYSFAGGASSVSNLVSWPVPFGAVSKSGGWKVTSGANVSLFCVGKFS